MPDPVSLTLTVIPPIPVTGPSARTVMPPRDVYRTAFSTRLGQHLAQRRRVGVDAPGLRRRRERERQSLRLRDTLHAGEDVGHDSRQVVRHHVRLPTPRFVAREIEQVVHDALHAPRVRLDGLQEPTAILRR